MSQATRNLRTLASLAEAFNDHDLDRIMEFFADDCSLDMPRGSSPWGTRYLGKAAVREGLQTRFQLLPDVHYGDVRHFATETMGVSEWLVTGTLVSGQAIAARGCDHYEFREGKVARKDSYWKIVEADKPHEDPMPETRVVRTRFEHANPILKVANLVRSVRYYVDVLGFVNAEWALDDFTCVTRDGASIYLSEGDQGQPGTWVWVGVEDVEALHDEYIRNGAAILEPPTNFPWALEMKVSDPDTHVLRFGSDPKDEA